MQQIDSPVIFLPGTLCDERIWLPVWRNLTLSNRSYVPLQWANALEEMLALSFDRIEQQSQPVHLVGFSMGGYIAALAALAKPGKVASLTLVGYHPGGLSETELTQRKGILKAIEKKSFTGMNQARLGHFLTEQEANLSDLSSTIIQMESDLGPAVLASHIRSTTPRKDLIGELSQAKFPVHFITAQHDKIAPANGIKTVSQGMKKSQFTQIENTAHMMLLAHPQECADKIAKFITTIDN